MIKVTAAHLCRLLHSQLSELIFLAELPECEIPTGVCQAEVAEKVIELAEERNIDLSSYPILQRVLNSK